MEAAIRARRTHKQYGSEPVDPGVVAELVDLARWAPNHHLTQPWRFRMLGAQTRARLDECCGPKEAMKLGRAPTLVLATAKLSGDPHTDEEDLAAVACAVYAVLLGATDRGLASYWRTPGAFETDEARAVLGLEPDEKIVALIHLGTAAGSPPDKERERLPLAEVLTAFPDAGERGRTSKGRSPPGPKPGASASSATPARTELRTSPRMAPGGVEPPHGASKAPALSTELRGRARTPAPARVANGTRTRDHRDHNPGLYQLSYRHQARPSYRGPDEARPARASSCGAASPRSSPSRAGRRACPRRTPRSSSR